MAGIFVVRFLPLGDGGGLVLWSGVLPLDVIQERGAIVPDCVVLQRRISCRCIRWILLARVIAKMNGLGHLNLFWRQISIGNQDVGTELEQLINFWASQWPQEQYNFSRSVIVS